MKNPLPDVRVAIPPALRPLCGNRGELWIAAHDVRGVLAEIARIHPEVHVRICDEQGEPRPHINVFVNHDHVRLRDGLTTVLTVGDLVTILPAVSGG